jgi:hypothetical protein
MLRKSFFRPVFADVGSPLTCFGVGGVATRVYFLDTSNDVYEAAWESGWVTTNLTVAAKAPSAGMFSGLTCFGVGGTATRVYYADTNGDVYELAWENGSWVATNVTAKAGAPRADGGNNLTCFGVGGTDSRVYYTDTVSVYELAWENGGWVATNITAKAGAASIYRGTPLTCFGVGGTTSRIYYLDNNSHVQELAWETGGWVATDVTARAGGPAANTEGGLTCFGVGGTTSRVYYIGWGSGKYGVFELAWVDRWVLTDVTTMASGPGTMGPLSCFGVGGVASRVYYPSFNGADQDVYELAWENGGWVSTNLTAMAHARAASNSSTVACFGVGGTATRVYYVDGTGPPGTGDNNLLPTGLVNELAWEDGWVWSVT